MGQRRRRNDDKPAARLLAEVKAMRRWMGERVFWGVSAVLVVAVVAFVAVLATGFGSSSSSTSSSSASTSSTSQRSSVDYSNPKVQEFVTWVRPIIRDRAYMDGWVTVGWQVCDWFDQGDTAGQVEYRISESPSLMAQLGPSEQPTSAPGNLMRYASTTLCRPY